MSERSEGIEWDDTTGEVRFTYRDATYVIPPPSFGQFRKAMELDQQRVESERKSLHASQVKALDDEARARAIETNKKRLAELEFGTPEYDEVRAKVEDLLGFILVLEPSIIIDSRERCIHWWCDLANLLGVEGFPTVDELPTWASNFGAIGKTIDHWVSFPFQDLGASPPPEPEPPAAEGQE